MRRPEEVLFITIYMAVTNKHGGQIIIAPELPEIHVVTFRVTGDTGKTGKFRPYEVWPVHGFPVPLSVRDAMSVVKALNEAAVDQVQQPVQDITRAMLQLEEAAGLPKRILRMAT